MAWTPKSESKSLASAEVVQAEEPQAMAFKTFSDTDTSRTAWAVTTQSQLDQNIAEALGPVIPEGSRLINGAAGWVLEALPVAKTKPPLPKGATRHPVFDARLLEPPDAAAFMKGQKSG